MEGRAARARRSRSRSRSRSSGSGTAAPKKRRAAERREELHVTGATGFLGTELLRLAPGATRERVEVRDAAAVRALLERVRPDVVIHTAYRQDGEGAGAIVVDGSENVARAAAAVGARLIHLSTDVVFDGRKGAPYVEEDIAVAVHGVRSSEGRRGSPCRRGAPGALDRPHVVDRRWARATSRRSTSCAAARPRCDLLRRRDPLAGPGGRSRRGTARARAARRLRAAQRRGRRRPLPCRPRRARRGARATRPAPPGRPLDCSLDSSRAQALLRTRLRGVREVLRRGVPRDVRPRRHQASWL